jgi:putative photosynthetic complex assembly protein
MTFVPTSVAAHELPQPRILTRDQAVRERQARLMIKLVFMIAGLALLLTVLAKATGIGTERVARGEPVASVAVTLVQLEDGQFVFAHAPSGEVIKQYSPAQGGFLRSVVRAFSLKRNAGGVDAATPYEITQWSSGRITLDDPSTGHRVPLDSFGASVTRMFAPLFEVKNTAQVN